MELESMKERHALLKRKANESINEILNCGQSSTSPQKRSKKSQAQKIRDIDSYKKIIKTYKAPIWYGCAVSPRDLADFGWACVKKDSVKCVECDQYLSTGLPNICKVSFNVYNTCLEDVHEKMVTAHRSTCKLRSGAPPFRIVDPTSKEILDGIKSRLSYTNAIDAGDLKALLQDIPSDVNLPKMEGIAPELVFLSALGWQVSKPRRGTLILGCDHCARELAIRSGNKFDPIHNHESWCPRIEMDELGEPSWQTDLNILLNTRNRGVTKYSDSSIFKEAYAARRLLDSSLSTIITPTYI
ncbi:unnamed protein product [Caenorhabditis sp. 36 PRJEB53466]|nr:unnamed protein product [Caenorhabditis sp. 36 PRJEB53466]